MTLEGILREFCKGCSDTIGKDASCCEECLEAAMNAIELWANDYRDRAAKAEQNLGLALSEVNKKSREIENLTAQSRAMLEFVHRVASEAQDIIDEEQGDRSCA